MQYNKTVNYKIPQLPSFIRGENDNPISISEFTESELKMIGEAWTNALIEKSKQLQTTK